MGRYGNARQLALVAIAALAVGWAGGCSDDGDDGPRNELARYDAEVVTAWFDLFLDITADERLNPPIASRAFAYQGITLYEAIVPGLGTHQSLVGQLNGLTAVPKAQSAAYHWPTVANAAMADIARRLYVDASAENKQLIDDLEDSFADQFRVEAGEATFERSVTRGQTVAVAIYDWAFTDGYFQYHNCAYTPPQGTGLWVPTPPAFAPALEPCWGQLRNYALELPTVCAPEPPPPYDENPASPFYVEMAEVFNTTTHLTEEQEVIAHFWADGAGTITPPGHWFSILNQLTTDNEWGLDIACEAYAKLGIAVGESFLSCWRAKFTHNLLRPITCIRIVFDAGWNPPITTPPFPEYTSGHSVQSGAAAQVLTDLFGHMPFEDRTYEGTMANRQFNDFFDAADEAAISRLYGGIHFRSAIEDGLQQGICIGQKISALDFLR
ncbi:MAG TPA: vanadium-dependent haloperoxidase [bacterium]|nr:vanadium-dependent haloperoxidase [bacterium]